MGWSGGRPLSPYGGTRMMDPWAGPRLVNLASSAPIDNVGWMHNCAVDRHVDFPEDFFIDAGKLRLYYNTMLGRLFVENIP